MTNQISILNRTVRQFENLFSLNDLHKISGSLAKHKPANFVRLDTTQELIAEISSENSQSLKSNCSDLSSLVITSIEGRKGGTYACEEIVLAYAMWISPKFHLVVLRAFLAMHKQQAQLPAPNPNSKTLHWKLDDIQTMSWLWFSHGKMNELLEMLLPALKTIQSKYHATAYSHVHEYKRLYKQAQPLILELLQDIPVLPDNRHHLNVVIGAARETPNTYPAKPRRQINF